MDPYTVAIIKKLGIEEQVETAATKSPFIEGLANGTAPPGAFKRWLYEDRIYVQGCSLCLAKAINAITHEKGFPKEALDLFLGAYNVITPELAHFEARCKESNVEMPKLKPVPTSWEQALQDNKPEEYYHLSAPDCKSYIQFMTQELFEIPGTSGIDYFMAFYLNEVIYHRAWKFVRESKQFQKNCPEEMEFVKWWGQPSFGKFVENLARSIQDVPFTSATVDIAKKICNFEYRFFSTAFEKA
ncbi:TENA/THI family protein, domain found in context with a broad range of enzymes [Schizosaccharomyces pombe]|uniref:Uncharacterized protein C530.07c n=1 Tax=Schizosaccharomyces pombe (strain 972 / ATCC 24843) TaxID=284812 RepID=YN27_SCHPO|nr:TENA/THI family protein [Schizosaccharomyces pombe]O59743.1 RecName: Full=Uncharacterized protein C530.07c [Schizosaccharomyces pombe 972h-]CAA19173.1 TENA/THI family protein [Schizosaccharomyces pombe]|eukprot:NP_595320.1 TENA/THI family protein [Schizosaccharomyces pombe]